MRGHSTLDPPPGLGRGAEMGGENNDPMMATGKVHYIVRYIYEKRRTSVTAIFCSSVFVYENIKKKKIYQY